MSDCIVCTLCDNPGTLDGAREVAKIPACVEKFRDETFTVWRCTNCGSLHSKESVNLPDYYEHYPFKDHKLDYVARVGYQNRIRLLENVGIKRDNAILDYGCGSGIFLEMLEEAGFTNVSGFDPFIPKYSDRSVLEKHFDVVTSYDVIEHVEDPREYLFALLDPLAVGGTLVLGTPNADHIPLKKDPYFPVELSQPYHRHIFSEKQLLALGEKFGLEVLSTYRRF